MSRAAPDVGGPAKPSTRGFRGLAALARRDITPPVGIRNRNWGPAPFDTADGVHRAFALTALALSRPRGETVLWIALDATWWRAVRDEAAVRGSILRALSLAEHQLLISLSHTHAGAVLCTAERDLVGGELVPPYLDAISAAAVDAGREALSRLAPATVEWLGGRCAVASNRDLDVDGRALVGFNPAVPPDDTLTVGRVCGSDGAVIGTVVNYACHPTTLAWENRKLSPDYVGRLRDVVETATGAPCMFVQGASGDLAPREQYSGDLALADRHGAAIGYAALSALETASPPGTALQLAGVVESGAPLAVWSPAPAELSAELHASVSEVALPLRRLPTLEELEQDWSHIEPQSRAERLRRARVLRDDYILDSGQKTVTHRIWTVRIGDAVLVAHPGEAYSAFQTELRSRFPDRPLIVANLTNGPGFAYLPDSDAYRRNAYQAWQTPFAEGALERLTDGATVAVQGILTRRSGDEDH